MARRNGSHAAVRTRSAAMDQLVVRRFAPFVAAHVRLGRADLRAVERRDGVVAMERNSRGSRRGDAGFDVLQHDRLHVVSHGFEKRPQGLGLHAARRRLDRHGILVHGRRVFVAVADSGQRILARDMARAVVRIYGRLRRFAVGAALQYPLLRGDPRTAQCGPLGRGGRHAARPGRRIAGHLVELAATRRRDGRGERRPAQRGLLRQIQRPRGVEGGGHPPHAGGSGRSATSSTC